MARKEILKSLLIIFWIFVGLFILSIIIKQFVKSPNNQEQTNKSSEFSEQTNNSSELNQPTNNNVIGNQENIPGEKITHDVEIINNTNNDNMPIESETSYIRNYPYLFSDMKYCNSNNNNEISDDVVEKINKLRDNDKLYSGKNISDIYDNITYQSNDTTNKCIKKPYFDLLTNQPIYFDKTIEDNKALDHSIWEYNNEKVCNGGKFGEVYGYDPKSDKKTVVPIYKLT